MSFISKRTWWSNGKQADVHLTQSEAKACHTPYHSPHPPAKHKHILDHIFHIIGLS